MDRVLSARLYPGCRRRISNNDSIAGPSGIKDDGADGLLIVIPAFLAGVVCALAVVYAAYVSGWDWKWSAAMALASAPGVAAGTAVVRLLVWVVKAFVTFCSKPLF